MTTNKPEVFRFHCHGPSAPAYSCNRPLDNSGEYVRLSDYEALQAECEKLHSKTRVSLGVGDGGGSLFVQGDYDSIKRVQALIFEREKLRKDAERYRWLRDPCSGAERVVMYGRGDYGRGLMAYTMLDEAIDDAMQEETK